MEFLTNGIAMRQARVAARYASVFRKVQFLIQLKICVHFFKFN